MKNLLFILIFLATLPFSYAQNLLKNIAHSDASSDILESNSFSKSSFKKGDTLFFSATDTLLMFNNFKEMWMSIGTSGTTKKITNNSNSSEVGFQKALCAYNDKFYYQVSLSNAYLYATDGNTNTLIKDFGNTNFIETATVLGGWVYLFVSANNRNRLELWKTDGTSLNTTKVTDIVLGYFYLDYLNDNTFYNAGDKVYFNLSSSTYGSEPWVTDGTEIGTRILKDLNPGTGGSQPQAFEKVGNNIMFFATDNFYNRKLWKTDGTEAGTVIPFTNIGGTMNYQPFWHIALGNYYYFFANYNKLYKTDGTNLSLVDSGGVPLGNSMVLVNGNIYFFKKNVNDYELWKSNGLTAEKIKTIIVSNDALEVKFQAGQTKVFFVIYKFTNASFQNITQHWVSDGTPVGTYNLNSINSTFSVGSLNTSINIINDNYYFSAFDNNNGFELWKSDGTSSGTSIVKNINKDFGSSNPTQFVSLNNTVFFVANDIKHDNEIWVTKGTAASTQLFIDYNSSGSVKVNFGSDIYGMSAFGNNIIAQIANNVVKFNENNPPSVIHNSGLLNPKNPEFTQFNNKLYFKGWDIANAGYELYSTDGLTVEKIKDFTTDFNGGEPTKFLVYQGYLYFTTENNSKLWRSDGTEVGTILIKTFEYNAINSAIYGLNGQIFFAANTSTYGLELWKSDGTEAGTTIVKDIYSGNGSSYTDNIVLFNGFIYFVAFNGSGFFLWKSDGTSANTSIAVTTGIRGKPIVFKNKLFYVAFDYSNNKYALWTYDGTNTAKLKDIAENLIFTLNMQFAKIGDTALIFDVLPNQDLHELWISDGTSIGTRFLRTLRNVPISAISPIKEYLYLNNTLYFAVNDGINGNELWSMNFECIESLIVSNSIIQDSNFIADKYVIGQSVIEIPSKVSFKANNYILLNSGFESKKGSVFSASMGGCQNIGQTPSNTDSDKPNFTNADSNQKAVPSIQHFLSEPKNFEMLNAYQIEMSKNNQNQILWIIEQKSDFYILKMIVGTKEYVAYMNK